MIHLRIIPDGLRRALASLDDAPPPEPPKPEPPTPPPAP
jgi:hypothetical protein